MVTKRLVDLKAANQLNISITTITPAQSWRRQVRGAYSLLYLYAQQDFLHIEDFKVWLQTIYQTHTHGNGNNGAPTTKPLQFSKLTDARAKALLIPARALGKIRRGILGATRLISDISNVNLRNF